MSLGSALGLSFSKETVMKCMWMISMLLAACSGGSAATKPDAPSGPPPFTAYVHGALADSDLAKAQATHDQFAGAAADAAHAAGDRAHHVLLGTGEPDPSRKNEFLAIDEWLTVEGARGVYGDPKFQAGFGALFAQPVAPELYRRRPDWHTWGDLAPPANGGPYWFMIVKGHLAKATEAENRAAHDAVASGFQAAAMKAGDIAHVPHISIDDPRVFFNVDVSTNHEGMLAVLSDPQFQQAFGALFDAPPEVHIYQSTTWRQW
jgi:hypothetical protein